MKLQDIANVLNIAISTVSRAIKDKYLSFGIEIMPLSYFLNKEISEGVSEYRLIERLKEVITNEDKNKTLSDEQISLKLKKEGIFVSRKTGNNYRNKLMLMNSKVRRNQHIIYDDYEKDVTL